MILGLEISQTTLNLQVTAWCAIKLKDSRSTGLTQLLWTISAQPRLLCASVSLLIKTSCTQSPWLLTHIFETQRKPKEHSESGKTCSDVIQRRLHWFDSCQLVIAQCLLWQWPWGLHKCQWYFFSITIAQSTCCQLKSMLSKSTSEWPQLGPNSTSSSKSIASTYISAIYSHPTPHLIEKHKNNEDLYHMVQRQHLKNT
jgi:hypothetical protein